MTALYDTHAHLDDPQFSADLPAVLDRARAAGITRIITIGTDLRSSAEAIRLSEAHPALFAAVGWHPNQALEAPADIRTPLRALARHPKVVAVGETGLDHHYLPSRQAGGTLTADQAAKDKQVALFRQQLEVAAELGLNCVIHQREAMAEVLAELTPFAASVRGVFHCFGGTLEEMQSVLALGSLVSFTGILTFKNAAGVREALQTVPLDQFMLETDCPYLAPLPYRGRRCEPAHLLETATLAAQLRGLSLDQLSAATCATAHRFFARLG